MSVSQDQINRIISRQKQLKEVGDSLKQHFVGIDEVIDKIIRNIEVWYVMPELMSRPLIVNLWGMTGVGKTDLVRRLIRRLNFNDKFFEVQLTNRGCSINPFSSSLHSLLVGSGIESDKPGVLLLDEIQRFRTKDEDGHDIHEAKFQDVWMLLSDGRFSASSDIREELYRLLIDIQYDKDRRENGTNEEDDDDPDPDDPDFGDRSHQSKSSKRKYKQTYWGAKTLKNACRLVEPIEQIMKWDVDKQLSIIEKSLRSQETYEGDSYSKLLIFVSGNLDEAYEMSGLSQEADIDADLFHKHSQRINLISIKRALSNRFKPEQIARLGNTHIIYPSLSRDSYEKIIERKIEESKVRIAEEFGINISVHPSVNEAIYRNGVFPVQGTRPLFSTINSFYEPALPRFVLQALLAKQSEMKIYYDEKYICARIGDEHFRQRNEGDLDVIKIAKHNDGKHVCVSVHEAGHAVAYAVLFGVVPTQIAVSTTSDDAEGFVGLHEISYTAPLIKNAIAVYLAGRAAEEKMFGKDAGLGAGASGDIGKATTLAARYCRTYGMQNLPAVDLPANSSPQAINSFTDVDDTNKHLKKLLETAKAKVDQIFVAHDDLLEQVSRILVEEKAMSPHRFREVCELHGVEAKLLDAKETIYDSYVEEYENRVGTLPAIARSDKYQNIYSAADFKKKNQGAKIGVASERVRGAGR